MVRRDKSNYIIQSVAHALDVLEEFRGDVDELGVTELSKKLKLHKNNVFRILATLQSRTYIEPLTLDSVAVTGGQVVSVAVPIAPSVRSATNALSSQPFSRIIFIRPLRSAMSVPGLC